MKLIHKLHSPFSNAEGATNAVAAAFAAADAEANNVTLLRGLFLKNIKHKNLEYKLCLTIIYKNRE